MPEGELLKNQVETFAATAVSVRLRVRECPEHEFSIGQRRNMLIGIMLAQQWRSLVRQARIAPKCSTMLISSVITAERVDVAQRLARNITSIDGSWNASDSCKPYKIETKKKSHSKMTVHDFWYGRQKMTSFVAVLRSVRRPEPPFFGKSDYKNDFKIDFFVQKNTFFGQKMTLK